MVRGVLATAYRGVIYVPAVPGSGREEVTVWIDREGLVRRQVERQGRDRTVRDYYRFGISVNVKAPPAREVANHAC